jgi:hypothetical protein
LINVDDLRTFYLSPLIDLLVAKDMFKCSATLAPRSTVFPNVATFQLERIYLYMTFDVIEAGTNTVQNVYK